MVDVAGHVGMALLWLAPAWLVVDDRKTAAVFVALGAPLGMLPDADLYVQRVLPTVKHHGVFHTVVAVVAFALVLAPVLGVALRALDDAVEACSLPSRATDSTTRLAGVAVLVAGSAHVFADTLSAPDVAESVEPFWPLYRQSLGYDVIYYDSLVWNAAFLLAGVAVNLALWRWRRER